MYPDTPMTGANTLHPNSEITAVRQIEYSKEAKTYITARRQRMIAARDVRDAPREEWDDMTFFEWHDKMTKSDNQYVAPRKNAQDTSINTGTVRDKDTTLVEYVSKFDFEPVAQVYDESDDLLEELAEVAEDLVRKSLLLEERAEKQKLISRSMITYGTAMVEDLWMERWTKEKIFGTSTPMGSINSQWTERMVKSYDGCQMKLWDLRKIYPGDIRKFFVNGAQGQPFLFTVEYESYDTTKAMFGDWDRWDCVPKIVTPTPEAGSVSEVFMSAWTLRPISMNYCEIVRYYDPIANEFAITINGIDMLPIQERKVLVDGAERTLISGFPLTAVSPSGGIPFAKFDFEPMHDFFYSKGQPSKMRVLADVENMWLKLLIGMMKQKAKPTMGNKSGRNFDSSVTDPATIVNDIRDGDLFPVLPNFQGAGPQDFSFYELIKKELDKNSVERDFQGINSNTQANETATGDMSDMKAQSLKVAACFDGMISGHSQLFWLRTYNIARNYTKPIDVRIDSFTKGLQMKYKTVVLPSEISGGQKATKKIVFTKDTTKTSDDVHQEELDFGKANSGKEMRITYIHPELFATMRFKWYYSCIPIPNGSDPMAYIMFAKQITDAIAFFGNESLNVKKLKHKFAAITGNDFDTWFLNEQELQQKKQQLASENAAGASAGQGGSATVSPPLQTVGPGNNSPQTPTLGNSLAGKFPTQSMGLAMK